MPFLRSKRTEHRVRGRLRPITLTGPAPAFLISDELKDFQVLLLAFYEMCTAFNELKTVRRRRKDFFADESNSFGIGIDCLAQTLEPLRRVNRVTDDRVVDSIWRADVAHNDWAHVGELFIR